MGLGANNEHVSTTVGDSGASLFYRGSNGGNAKNDDEHGITPLKKVKVDLTNALTTIKTNFNEKTYFIAK